MNEAVLLTEPDRPVLRAFNVAAAGFLFACAAVVLAGPGMLDSAMQIRSLEDAATFTEHAAALLAAMPFTLGILIILSLSSWALLAAHLNESTYPEISNSEQGSEPVRRVDVAPADAKADRRVEAELELALSEIDRLRKAADSGDRALLDAQQSHSRFVSHVSHELRTPLNGIVGMSDMLLDSELSGDQKRCVASILSAAGGLVGEVDALIDFARFDSGELRLERSRFDLRQSVEDVCTAVSSTAHVRGLELVFYADDDLPNVVDGDGKRLRQIVRTLVDNAIRHTDEGEVVVRVVRMESLEDKTRFRIDVQDSGKGMTPEQQLALWKVFEGNDASSAGALGQSMQVTSALVRLMDGKILIKSRLGEGTRFSAEVLLGDVVGSHESSTSERSLDGVRALIVDDNLTNLTVLEHQLNRWGIEVTSATSGKEALQIVQAEAEFNIGIFDLNMPEMDGLELAQRVNDETSTVQLPILMLTSSEIDLSTDEMDKIGIQRNLSKPPRRTDLRDTLAAMVAPTGDTAEVVRLHEPKVPSTIVELDTAALDAIRERQRPGKPDVLARAVSSWLNRMPEVLVELEQASAGNDRNEVLRALTSLAQSSGFIGARRVVAVSHRVEQHVQELDETTSLADDAVLIKGLEDIAAACESVSPALQELAA